MKIYIRMFGRFRHEFWDRKEVDVHEDITLLDVLQEIIPLHSEGHSAIFNERNQIRNHIILMVNKKRIPHADTVAVSLCEADEIAVLPPVAGG